MQGGVTRIFRLMNSSVQLVKRFLRPRSKSKEDRRLGLVMNKRYRMSYRE